MSSRHKCSAGFAIVLVACSFDSAPIQLSSGSPARDEVDAGRSQSNRPTASDALGPDAGGSGSGTSAGDAGQAKLDATLAAREATRTVPDKEAQADSGVDAAVDAGSDDAECEAQACRCPHEAPEKDPVCPRELCKISDCAPGDACRYESSDVGSYYVRDDSRTWEQAYSACQGRDGMRLVAIESKAEDALLFSLVSDKTWIGGSDAKDEGTWLWPDGTAFYQQGGSMSGPIADAYENWDAVEPNNLGLGLGSGNCLILWYENLDWADATCADTHGYICEVIEVAH